MDEVAYIYVELTVPFYWPQTMACQNWELLGERANPNQSDREKGMFYCVGNYPIFT